MHDMYRLTDRLTSERVGVLRVCAHVDCWEQWVGDGCCSSGHGIRVWGQMSRRDSGG